MVRHEDIARMAERHGVILLLLFGSSVTGRSHAHSDVDIGVLLEGDACSFERRADLLADLQEAFPGREVDLSILNTADPFFLHKVTASCELLYGSPRRLAELKIYAFKRYQDHRRFLSLERDYVRRTLDQLVAR